MALTRELKDFTRAVRVTAGRALPIRTRNKGPSGAGAVVASERGLLADFGFKWLFLRTAKRLLARNPCLSNDFGAMC
jgi:hypothetical protein